MDQPQRVRDFGAERPSGKRKGVPGQGQQADDAATLHQAPHGQAAAKHQGDGMTLSRANRGEQRLLAPFLPVWRGEGLFVARCRIDGHP